MGNTNPLFHPLIRVREGRSKTYKIVHIIEHVLSGAVRIEGRIKIVDQRRRGFALHPPFVTRQGYISVPLGELFFCGYATIVVILCGG
jgi:hypothetical protein